MGHPLKATEFVRSRRAGGLTAVVLTVFIVPQLILLASPRPGVQFIAMISMGVASALAFGVMVFQDRILPASSSPRLVATYIGEGTGVVASSARLVSYALVVVLGGRLAVRGLAGIVDLGGYERVLLVVVVLCLAVPGMIGWRPPALLLYAVSLCATVALAAVLIYGMVTESTGGYPADTLESTRAYAAASTLSERGAVSSVGTVLLTGLVPSGFLVLAVERRAVRKEDRAQNFRMQGWRAVAGFLAIAVTLYFESTFSMPGHTNVVPLMAMAYGFFGHLGHTIVAAITIAAGIAAAMAAYSTLPHLVRALSVDRILPHHLAAENSARSRLLTVAVTAVMAGLIAVIGRSSQAGAMMFTFCAFVLFTLSCAAMAFRGSSILKESLDKEERSRARVSRWLFGLCSLAGLMVLIAIAIVNVWWAVSALVALAVPAILLIFFRRGRVRVVRQLAATDLSAGRTLPTRVHGVILVSALDLPTLRTVSFARATRLTSLTAVTLDFDPRTTKKLRQDWRAAALPVDLTVLGTPEGASTQNVVDYVRSMRRVHQADIVMVFIPRVLSTGMWQRFFVRHSEPRIISDLRLQEGVVISEVPYQLQPQDEDEHDRD